MIDEEFEIQSNAESMIEVEDRLFHFCHTYNIGSYFSTISYAAKQAVENAVVHGNGCASGKTVGVRMGECRGGVFVEVADQGNGFDYARYGGLPDGQEDPGEGIFVMKRLADKVEYSAGGRKVRLEFMVDGVDQSVAMGRIETLQHYFAKERALA